MVFCFRLEARRSFEVLEVAFWALFVEKVFLFLNVSASFLVAFLMMADMALWHRGGMSSTLGGSESLST